jgi:hypothetical protein
MEVGRYSLNRQSAEGVPIGVERNCDFLAGVRNVTKYNQSVRVFRERGGNAFRCDNPDQDVFWKRAESIMRRADLWIGQLRSRIAPPAWEWDLSLLQQREAEYQAAPFG